MPLDKQARRQEFLEGVRRLASRVAHLAAGVLGATQGSLKPWGIWSKILQSSIFQVLPSNFQKVLFFETDLYFHQSNFTPIRTFIVTV